MKKEKGLGQAQTEPAWSGCGAVKGADFTITGFISFPSGKPVFFEDETVAMSRDYRRRSPNVGVPRASATGMTPAVGSDGSFGMRITRTMFQHATTPGHNVL